MFPVKKDSGNLTFNDFSKKLPQNEASDSYKNGDFLILSQTLRKTRRELFYTYENFCVIFKKFSKDFSRLIKMSGFFSDIGLFQRFKMKVYL